MFQGFNLCRVELADMVSATSFTAHTFSENECEKNVFVIDLIGVTSWDTAKKADRALLATREFLEGREIWSDSYFSKDDPLGTLASVYVKAEDMMWHDAVCIFDEHGEYLPWLCLSTWLLSEGYATQ